MSHDNRMNEPLNGPVNSQEKDRDLDSGLSAKDALVAMGQDGRAMLPDPEHPDKPLLVHRTDVQKLIAMGLSDLPIDAIAVSRESPILHTHDLKLRQTLDISNNLTRYFPGHVVAALYELQSLVRNSGFQAYVIGGNVRDVLLYKTRLLEIRDVDITVEGDALEASAYICANSKNFAVKTTYPEFGTVKVQYKDSIHFDFASTRKEIYRSCGALPEVVERGVSLAEDIIRRDFSVNALALSIHNLGEILDHAAGIEDVDRRLIRVLHPLSFFEDPSRILRAFKFLARLDFQLTPATHRLMDQFLKHGAHGVQGSTLYHGGGDRIKHELRKFVTNEETPVKQFWIGFFLEHRCIRLINMAIEGSPLGGFPSNDAMRERFHRIHAWSPYLQDTFSREEAKGFLWELYLCFLLGFLDADLFLESAHRLGLTRVEREGVEAFRECLESGVLDQVHETSSPADIYDLCHEYPASALAAAALEQYGQESGRFKTVIQAIQACKNKFERIKPELNGNDLIELGIPEGETVGALLKELLHAKLSGRLKDRMAEVRYIQHKLGREPKIPEHGERLHGERAPEEDPQLPQPPKQPSENSKNSEAKAHDTTPSPP